MYQQAAAHLRRSRRTVAFTGAGVSVESGIPPFRGPDGLWSRYDSSCLDISVFKARPAATWAIIKEVFYDFFGSARPNAAHAALATLEREGLLHAVVTQNIDGLHQEAGNTVVREFHGNSRDLVCLDCDIRTPAKGVDLSSLPPRCTHCSGVLKPDFVFFGEAIPEPAQTRSLADAAGCNVMLVIGTAGAVMPASYLPRYAKGQGATIIEVNTEPSSFTQGVSDLFLRGPATREMNRLLEALELHPEA